MPQVTHSAPPIYLDHASSAPPAPEVVEAMLPWLKGHANPHAVHWHGLRAARAIDSAREAIADLIQGDPAGVIFTSGATESNNLALKGFLGDRLRDLYMAASEHKSLLEPARALADAGKVGLRILRIDSEGRLNVDVLEQMLSVQRAVPAVVAFSHGNNELGTVQDLGHLVDVIHRGGGVAHADASQTAGHLPLSVVDSGVDMLCLSSHKMYGPAGIGALYVAPDLLPMLTPILHGGGQEGGWRSGTVAPYLAVGFGEAARLARQEGVHYREHLGAVTGAFLAELAAQGIAFQGLGSDMQRLPGHLSLQFSKVGADDLLGRLLGQVSASTGAACAAGELRASHALRAIGLSEDEAARVVRVSLGRTTTIGDAQAAARAIALTIMRMTSGEGA